jgi:hypothetical protein
MDVYIATFDRSALRRSLCARQEGELPISIKESSGDVEKVTLCTPGTASSRAAIC